MSVESQPGRGRGAGAARRESEAVVADRRREALVERRHDPVNLDRPQRLPQLGVVRRSAEGERVADRPGAEERALRDVVARGER